MKDLLQKELTRANGPLEGSIIQSVDCVNGGCIHKAWQLKLENGQTLFAKTADKNNFSMLEFEANGLKIRTFGRDLTSKKRCLLATL